MPEPLAARRACTSSLMMYASRSAHSGGASAEQPNPSPPPSAAVGSPAAPSMPGIGNQPRKAGTSWSGVSPQIVPAFQLPMTSLAADRNSVEEGKRVSVSVDIG